jgi:hypothetical protein
VDGSIDQLAKLRKAIADYLKGLSISDLSPLTPAQKLAEAQKNYQDALAKAAAGDPTALADITKFADAYLKQARDFYASSPLYTAIFDQITKQLQDLVEGGKRGTQPPAITNVPGGEKPQTTLSPLNTGFEPLPPVNKPVTDLNTALFSALPATGNRLVSAEDLRKAMVSLEKVIADAMAATADVHDQNGDKIARAITNNASQIVDGLGGNLK